jgi:diguanylate cyclase (GGDEF)-like protein
MQKVVIVDDTRANGMLLEGFIKSLPSVAAYTFTRPLEALVWCDDHTPDLVLLDYVMPDIDGIEFLRRFRSLPHLRDVPVVMVTATLSKETLYLALHSGATDFLRKPVDRIELTARARNLLDLRLRQKDLEAANARLQMLASTDALTGLKNRRAFLDAVESELERSRRYGRPFAVATIDIDQFNMINEAHGHDVGDEILQAIAFMCAEQFRSVDQIGRIGGEEFGVLLAELPVEGAVTACSRLLSRVSRAPVPAAGREIEFTVSIGITDAGREQDSVIKIMKRAEHALMSAKRNGANRVELADGAVAAPVLHH